MDSLRRYFGPANVVGLLRQQSEGFEMNIEHRLEPIEHWIVDGKAYRLATEKDVGKNVSRSMDSIEECIEDWIFGGINALKQVHDEEPKFDTGSRWTFAIIQDDSLLTPQRTPVPALGDGWFLLTAEDGEFKQGDKISSDGNSRHWVPKSWPTHIKISDWLRHDSECRAARYFGPAKEPEPAVEIQPQSAKSIDWTKPVRTKDGRAVRVLCTDGPGDYPVCGYIDGDLEPQTWDLDGVFLNGGIGHLNLENAPQRIQREYWVNVYPEGSSGTHRTKKEADGAAGTERIACVKITIDCDEGEGL